MYIKYNKCTSRHRANYKFGNLVYVVILDASFTINLYVLQQRMAIPTVYR